MKEKIKRLLLVIITAILFSLTLGLSILNAGYVFTYFQIDPETSQKEKQEKEELEIEVWKNEIELKYLDRYCQISELLPQNDSPVISIEVDRYAGSLEISTPFNPFPGHSKVYEVGTVTQSDSNTIDINGDKMKLYRIELTKDSNTYIEYVSHRDIPLFYIVKDEASTEYLLYPSVIQYKDLISKEYYIEII